MSAYIGKSELTIARTPAGTQVYVYKGQGIDGAILDQDDLARLVDAGHLAEAKATSDTGVSSGSTSRGPSAAEVLAEVGDDPVKAQEVLEAEQAKDKPRSGLVKDLEAVIAKASQD